MYYQAEHVMERFPDLKKEKYTNELIEMILERNKSRKDVLIAVYENLMSRQLRYNMPVSFIVREIDLKGKKLLDVGCGTGQNFTAFEKAGITKFCGIDIEASGIRIARERVRCDGIQCTLIIGDFLEHDFEEERFDIINCFQVLEHIDRARQKITIEKMYHLLHEGGIIFIQTPNQLFPIDIHDSKLPFAHWLPRYVSKPYANMFGKTPPHNTFMCFRDIFKIVEHLPGAKIISRVDMGRSFGDFLKFRISSGRYRDWFIVLYAILHYPVMGRNIQRIFPNINMLIRKSIHKERE